ncbi:Uncharacterised protein [Vibrio cholerae]|uniref:Uncharacterized protein n=1 Tax=Vibrio cholerae TaxID=666 RepID=A0A655UHK5_VIBCL|nr:Uncharacterised protein [Vibrio cholerae]CSB54192.1 Uncharacterised protein [Vibrio cholerae]
MVEVPISSKETMRNSSPKPSTSLSNRGLSASGVLSRDVNPVPPVIRIAWMVSSAIHCETTARILYISSITICLSASVWPAS